MKNDEFSFFNQQLAAMVRDGIPLESALRRLCADMRRGPLRSELEKLEADLAKGMPVARGGRRPATARSLPPNARSRRAKQQPARRPHHAGRSLPAPPRRLDAAERVDGLSGDCVDRRISVVVLLGFHVDPVMLDTIVLPDSFGASDNEPFASSCGWRPSFLDWPVVIFEPLSLPSVRRALRWRFPAFREASLAQVASALALMLKSGVPLDKALALMERTGTRHARRHRNSPAGGNASPPAWASFPKWRRMDAFSRRFLSGQFRNRARICPPVSSTPPKPANPAPTTAPNCFFTPPCPVRCSPSAC